MKLKEFFVLIGFYLLLQGGLSGQTIRRDRFFGLTDTDGTVVLGQKYDTIFCPLNGLPLYVAGSEGKYGYITRVDSGSPWVRSPLVYDRIYALRTAGLNNGPHATEYVVLESGEKKGLLTYDVTSEYMGPFSRERHITATLKIDSLPVEYDRFDTESGDGLEHVLLTIVKEGKYGLVQKGRILLPPVYDTKIDWCPPFHFLAVFEGKTGIFAMDTAGAAQTCFPFSYDKVRYAGGGMFWTYSTEANILTVLDGVNGTSFVVCNDRGIPLKAPDPGNHYFVYCDRSTHWEHYCAPDQNGLLYVEKYVSWEELPSWNPAFEGTTELYVYNRSGALQLAFADTGAVYSWQEDILLEAKPAPHGRKVVCTFYSMPDGRAVFSGKVKKGRYIWLSEVRRGDELWKVVTLRSKEGKSNDVVTGYFKM